MTHSQEQEDKNAVQTSWSRRDWWLPVCNAAIVAIVYLLFNDKLPDRVAAHFDIQGNANRYMSKQAFWATYAALTILLPVAMKLFRSIDPRRANYDKFGPYFHLSRWTISLFFQAFLIAVILHESGSSVALQNVILGAFGAMWMLLGNRMGQVRSNYFIGIRTPWALSDDANWSRTHRFAARLFFASGILMFVLAWFVPNGWALAALIVLALGSSLTPVVYSYCMHRRSLGQ